MEFHYSNRVKAMRPSVIRQLLVQTNDENLISFSGGNPDAAAFPSAQIREISAWLLENDPEGTLQYSVTDGYKPLRESGRQYLCSRYPVVCGGDEVIVTSGSQQTMDFMAKLLCNEGDPVAVENPAFLGAHNAFRSHGARLVGVEMEEDGVNLAALEAALAGDEKPRFFYTIPNYQNPMGATTSLAKRRAIYELCVKHGVPVFEDNPYGELRISGDAIPPIKSFDTESAVVYAVSLSKIFAPGMRVAFCVGQKELMDKMVVAKQGNDVHTTLWAQRVCDRFLRHYDMASHLAHIREIYRDKAHFMMDEMDRQMGGRVRYIRPAGGMFLWMTLPNGVDMLEFVKRCLAGKLAMVPGNAFFVDGDAPCQDVRLNFSGPSKEQIVQGVGIMARVLREMQGY